jgi:hypothetical protein
LKGVSVSIERKIVVFSKLWFVAAPAAFSPHYIGLTLIWRVTTEQRIYEGLCGGVMVVVHPASMLFGVWLSMTIGGCLSNWCPSLSQVLHPLF